MGGKTLGRIRRDHSLENARGLRRNIWRDNGEQERLLLEREQFDGGIRVTFDGRFAGDRVKERRAETVDVAAEIFRLTLQSFRCNVIRRAPNFAARFRGDSSQSEVADLREMLIGKKNVRRLHVAMN